MAKILNLCNINMIDLLQYGFILRGLEAGIVIALIAPLIGIFLVLRRYSLIADTLAHVSLAGVAIGLILNVNPIFSAITATVISSVAIERLRLTKKVYGESALALFLSGSLALAIILIGLANGFNVNLFNYLFGSIVTVKQIDVTIISIFGLVIASIISLFYKELIFVSFDEEAARVSGIPARLINTILIVLTAITVSLAIPIVGVLLISALIVIPVVAALQFGLSFTKTIIVSELISVFSVISGVFISYYLDLSPGGTIVLISLTIFCLVWFWRSKLE